MARDEAWSNSCDRRIVLLFGAAMTKVELDVKVNGSLTGVRIRRSSSDFCQKYNCLEKGSYSVSSRPMSSLDVKYFVLIT
jgi:hypothetical protein